LLGLPRFRCRLASARPIYDISILHELRFATNQAHRGPVLQQNKDINTVVTLDIWVNIGGVQV
jgi:hypothetical protein